MYLVSIILLMFVLPVASIVVEVLAFHNGTSIMWLAGKWFVFWAVGVRLFTAGLMQVINPRFTAEKILGTRDFNQSIIVQELGFANIAMGAFACLTILISSWVLPAAIVGCLFLGFAGLRHIFSKNKNVLERTAMFSNLFIAVVLLIYILVDLAGGAKP